VRRPATIILLVLLSIAFTAYAADQGKDTEKKPHASLTEQEKLIPCYDCHKETTPTIYKQWYSSTHGIGNVKCYQCHNTFENMAVSPDIQQSCNSCHAEQVNDADHTEGLEKCWECHQVHSFKAE